MVKVFISYAREDSETAKRFYNDLHRPGIQPWLDSSELQPGRLWDEDLRQAIIGSDYFLALISGSSLEEGGFVQKEWRLALDEGKAVIPVRLEERAPPKEMDPLQWVDLFPSYDEGLKKILRFLNSQQSRALFRETFSSIGPDNEGWDLSEWETSSDDHTGKGSEAIYAKVSLSSSRMLPQTVTKTASILVYLPGTTTLQYHRKLEFSVVLQGTAGFRVIIDDGTEHVIDEEIHTGNYTEDSWTARSINLSRYSSENVTLKFVATVTGGWNYLSHATVWVDDVAIF